MPTWPGGICPACGEEMPPNLIHCQNCRTLLNTDLEHDSVEIPAFEPLPEIEAMIELAPAGFYVLCPECRQELKIARKYSGERVQCKFCQADFRFDLTNPDLETPDFYADCPHCEERLRIASKYMNLKVACRFCGGKLHVVADDNETEKL